MRNSRRFRILFWSCALFCLVVAVSAACTIGVVSGSVSTDGRPVLWKNRDNRPVIQQRLTYFPAASAGTLAYIGVHTVNGEPAMGLNEAGVATGNSRADDKGRYIRNLRLGNHVLANCRNIDEIHAFIEEQVNLPVDESDDNWFSACFPFIDASGRAVMYEVSRSKKPDIGVWYRVYDTMNETREEQQLLGIVPRANTFHRRDDGTDNLSHRRHYRTCRINMQGLLELGILDASTIVQGSPDRKFDVLRYRRHDNSRDIARWWTLSAIVVHGVKEGEDPALATMWTMLGKPEYCIAVPAWVAVANIPDVLAKGYMWDRAESLYEKGESDIVQARILPAESHLFEMVNTVLLPHWRENGVPSESEMERVQHRMANDAYSLLDCLDNTRLDNKPPRIGPVQVVSGGDCGALEFSVEAADSDGEIAAYAWDFGDGNVFSDIAPRHKFAESGTYLVSCTVTDNDGVSITGWRYVTVD